MARFYFHKPKHTQLMTITKECTCKHAQQDAQNGKNQRVHNGAGKAEKKVWRCTVCKSEKPR